jgi:hypothetical protein
MSDVEIVKLSTLGKPQERGHKHTRAEREELRDRIASFRLRGMSFRDIATQTGLSVSFCYDEYKVVEQRWRHSANESIVQIKAQELARLDLVEAEAWRAYERSQAERTEAEERFSYDKDGQRVRDGGKAARRTRDGDAKFLQIVLDCIDRRTKLLGLASPDLIGAMPDGQSQPDNHGSLADRLARYQNVLGVAFVGVAGPADDAAGAGEPLHPARPASETGPILDVDGRVR